MLSTDEDCIGAGQSRFCFEGFAGGPEGQVSGFTRVVVRDDPDYVEGLFNLVVCGEDTDFFIRRWRYRNKQNLPTLLGDPHPIDIFRRFMDKAET
jgi:hypothetical protein